MALLDEGPLLKARLLARCPASAGNVFQTEDLKGVKAKSQVVPALHLVLHSYRTVADDGADSSLWRSIWLVVAVVRNQKQGVGAQAVLDEAAAGQLLAETIAALDGWRCPGKAGRVRAIEPPPLLVADGFGWFPLAFTVDCVTAGAADSDY